jgi:hypothetical protein
MVVRGVFNEPLREPSRELTKNLPETKWKAAQEP